jgi:hypothetical protein
MPGIFEYHSWGGVTERHQKIARLISSYKAAFNAAKGYQAHSLNPGHPRGQSNRDEKRRPHL